MAQYVFAPLLYFGRMERRGPKVEPVIWRRDSARRADVLHKDANDLLRALEALAKLVQK